MPKSDKKKILSVVKQTWKHAYLATVEGKQPMLRSVSPIVEDNLSFWVSTFAKSRKVEQIKKNPRVCLYFVKQPDGEKAVIVHGRAKITTSLKEKKRIWQLARFDLSYYFRGGPCSKEFCLLKIVPKTIEWWSSWRTGRKLYKA